ncbi:MAG: hypothetical protein JWO97_4443 [Acidobacteria bacterium]|nr:hypothetical protein [Acidobacteriota bacterium]
MFRRRGENLNSVYIFLFLNIVFFVFQFQDAQRYAHAFAFDRVAVMHGEFWRLFTYQYLQGGAFLFFNSSAISLFFTLLMLWIMGSALEEEWGTFNFVTFYLVSTLVTAAAGALLGVPLLGSFFVSYSLLFVYATLYPDQTFYVFYVLPVQVRWIAWIVLAILILGIFGGSTDAIAALAGAAASYAFFLIHRALPERQRAMPKAVAASGDQTLAGSTKNITRWTAMKNALTTKSDTDIDRLIAQAEQDIVPGVNICPPVDYKPEAADRYCVRCDGFAECSARHLRLNR